MRIVEQYDGYDGIYYFECRNSKEAQFKVDYIRNTMDVWMIQDSRIYYTVDVHETESGLMVVELKIFS